MTYGGSNPDHLTFLTPRLQGIILFHDELEFKSELGLIKDDNPNIFWEISARFHVFIPEVGAIVRGKVNK